MEKYSQFRDKVALLGTAIAPFFPVTTPPASSLWTPLHILLFVIRVPPVFFLSLFYFLVLEWLPVPQLVRKGVLWLILAIPGVWWVDLQVDGVKRGYVDIDPALCVAGYHSLPMSIYHLRKSRRTEEGARYRKLAEVPGHLPHPGTIIASSFTSPLDPLYLAGIFCPIFTRSYPSTRKVERISLFRAILLAFGPPSIFPGNPDNLVTMKELEAKHPQSIICVFPECTTTNGRGILPLCPSLLTANPKTRIYPVNVRYTPGDITTPVPGNYILWLWKLLSKPTHCMRVRIARSMYNNPTLDSPIVWGEKAAGKGSGVDMVVDTDIFDSLHLRNGIVKDGGEGETEGVGGKVKKDEQKVLDRVGEDLARLGRVKRVGLGVQDKIEFVKVWRKRRR
ncbi:uncharacterized protein BDR25DRAFT_345921 [Lindgomyces ingoldianus]|uniref:Uncharacterized protein n=1 Tax=Lindgomyces ingoldianus TaxID=673940 RepID=A0ACB6QHY2_9PLEO|nr:uncharacterized protein BDR25DRAFT_345921 [Lindgomyces ingoldianus]KAF2465727.1 hypothetical protein BDR25DRAFT_345921 [Lindgomyces ingoldianus]